MSHNRKGFALIESIIALTLVSFTLTFYLPSFYQQLQLKEEAQLTTHKWRLFYELVQIELRASEDKLLVQQDVLNYYNQTYGLDVTHFSATSQTCQLVLGDGDTLIIQRTSTEALP